MKNIYEIANDFDEIYMNIKNYKNFFEVSDKEAKESINEFEEIRIKAIGGDPNAKIFFLDKLSQYITKANLNIEKLINFNKLDNNNIEINLIIILEALCIKEIVEKENIDVKIDSQKIKNIINKYHSKIQICFNNANSRTKTVTKYIYSKIYGLDIIDFLAEQNINEVGFIRKDYLYIIIDNKKIHISFINFKNLDMIINLQKKAVLNSSKTYDKKNPILVSSRLNSNRIAVAGFDVTSGYEEFYLNKRIFNINKISLYQLKTVYQTLDSKIIEFLNLNQKGKGSFFVTGSDMNVGKSTFLLAMIEALPIIFTIGAIDEQNEMRLQQKFVNKNTITLISNDKKNIDECFEYLLKTSRDVLALSEITKPSEVTSLINAALRLNCGICATLHSFSPKEVIINLRNLMLRTKMYNNAEVAEVDIARGLDLIIHMKRIGKRIVVSSIDEVVFKNEDYNCEDSISYLLKRALIKYLDKKSYYLNRIFEFRENKFVKVNNPTKQYRDKLFKTLDKESKKLYLEKYT